VITAATLARRTKRKLDVLVRQVAGDPAFKDCRTPRCTSCSACRERSPLTGIPWAVLHARARGRPAHFADENGRFVRDPDVELLEGEQREAHAREWIQERDRQLALLDRFALDEQEHAEREFVVAARPEAA
jgi:hypothetical protein